MSKSNQATLMEYDRPTGQPDRWIDWHVYQECKQRENRGECANCGAHIMPQSGKVWGDEDDVAHACRECAASVSLFAGAAADPDMDITPSGGRY